MKLAMAYFFDEHADKIAIARQLGVTHAVSNASRRGNTIPAEGWDFAPFEARVRLFAAQGIKVDVVEGPTPFENAKLGLPGRDLEIETMCELIRRMDALDIRTLCYNWMPVVGWFRSRTDIPTRGGATVTGYCHADMQGAPLTEAGEVTAERMWDSLAYFLRAVVPVAENYGIRLAIHPDDPPVPSLRGIARILIDAGALERALSLVPSPNHGLTLCQGCFAAMGENPVEMIERFGREQKLFFAHFRDIRGHAYDFQETFHDDGQSDMYACMKAYCRAGFDGCIRPDHVPSMLGERSDHPGYGTMGNLYAIGYMRGLMTAAAKETEREREAYESAV
ncbi:mannonate dehydratase [Clostridia bacterium]|nr:mannonate dehydratase [Clostridia bacterium]